MAAEQASSGVAAVSETVVAAAERGEEEAVLAWLDSGGRADATYDEGEVSGLTLLMAADDFEAAIALRDRLHGARKAL